MKTCFLAGHSEVSEDISSRLETEIKRHIIEYGVCCFIVGGYGNFDHKAANIVKQLKTHYPHIKLVFLTPYYPPKIDATKYGYDSIFYPPDMESVPKRAAIVAATRLAVNISEHMIIYSRYFPSNTHNLLQYALKREKRGLIKICLL